MNEAYEAKRKQREEHLKAVLCGLFIKFREDMESCSAAVKAFEAFRKRMTVGIPVQKAAWLHSLIEEEQNLVPDEDMRRINAEFWRWDEEVYNERWLSEHQQDWELFASQATDYYTRLRDAYFENKEMKRIVDVSIISENLIDFIFRQRTLAEVSGEFFDTEAAYSYALIGYTYGIRADRERRRGSKKSVPVVHIHRRDHDERRLREPQNIG